MYMEIITLVFGIITILINIFFMLGIFGIPTIKDVADRHRSILTPHRYTFMFIWSLIYIWHMLFLIWAFNDLQIASYINIIGIYYIGWCVFNIVWIFVFCLGYVYLSIYANLAALVFAAICYIKLQIAYFGFPWYVIQNSDVTKIWVLMIPISITVAWMIIANILNTFAIGYIDSNEKEANIAFIVITYFHIFNAFWTAMSGDIVMNIVYAIAFCGIALENWKNHRARQIALISLIVLVSYNCLIFFLTLVFM